MVLSTKKNFLFIHGIKTAGSSFRSMLKPYRRKQDDFYLYKIIRKVPIIGQNYKFFDFYHHPHLSSARAKEIIPEKIFNNLIKIGIVRNPEEWMVSVYKHWKRHYELKDLKKVPDNVNSLEDFILFRMDNYAPLQALQFVDSSGVLILDEVGDFGNLEVFKNELDMKIKVNLKLEAFNSAPSSQKVIVSKKERSLIERACRLDYELFDFEKINDNGYISVKTENNLKSLLKHELVKAGGSNFDPWVFAPAISNNGYLK